MLISIKNSSYSSLFLYMNEAMMYLNFHGSQHAHCLDYYLHIMFRNVCYSWANTSQVQLLQSDQQHFLLADSGLSIFSTVLQTDCIYSKQIFFLLVYLMFSNWTKAQAFWSQQWNSLAFWAFISVKSCAIK